MKIDDIDNAIVQAAIEAMNARDRSAWFALFAPDTTLTDDGNPADFVAWSTHEIFEGGGRVTAVNKVENNGLLLYARFHSDEWGDFNTFMKFEIQDGIITRLDVGQAE